MLAVAALVAGGAAVAQTVITPVVIEFKPNQRIATVRVALAKSARPMRLQAQLLRWRQDLQGDAVTEPSSDLIVSPRIVDLQPGHTQVLRVALRRGLPADTEMAYRLLLEDVAEPATVQLGEAAHIKFRMAYDLPVMVPSKHPVNHSVQWRPCPTQATAANPSQALCVRLANTGNRRVKVQSLHLKGQGWQQHWPLKEPQNVLAGDEAEWHIPFSLKTAGAVNALTVRTMQGELLQAARKNGS